MEQFWLAPVIFIVVALLCAIEDARQDSHRLRWWQGFFLVLAATSYIAVETNLLGKLSTAGQEWLSHVATSDKQDTASADGEGQPQPSAPAKSDSSKTSTDRVPSLPGGTGPFRYTVSYPRQAFLPEYDRWVKTYPDLKTAFDALETARFAEARDAIQRVRAAIPAGRELALRAYLSHLHGVTLIELSFAKYALFSIDDALRDEIASGQPEIARIRLRIDRSLNLLALGMQGIALDPAIGRILRGNEGAHHQELALYYHARAGEHRRHGEMLSADLMHAEAVTQAKWLATTESEAANRLLALLGEPYAPLAVSPSTEPATTTKIVDQIPVTGKITDRVPQEPERPAPAPQEGLAFKPRHTVVPPPNALFNNYDDLITKVPQIESAYRAMDKGEWREAVEWLDKAQSWTRHIQDISPLSKSNYERTQVQYKFLTGLAWMELENPAKALDFLSPAERHFGVYVSQIPADYRRARISLNMALLLKGHRIKRSVFFSLRSDIQNAGADPYEMALVLHLMAVDSVARYGPQMEELEYRRTATKTIESMKEDDWHTKAKLLALLLERPELPYLKPATQAAPPTAKPLPVTNNSVDAPGISILPAKATSLFTGKPPRHIFLYPDAEVLEAASWSTVQRLQLVSLQGKLRDHDWLTASHMAAQQGFFAYNAKDRTTWRRSALLYQLAGEAALESGHPEAAIKALDFAVDTLKRAEAPDIEIARAEIDRAQAKLALGHSEALLPVNFMAQFLSRQYANQEEIALAYHVRARQLKASGDELLSVNMQQQAEITAKYLAKERPASAQALTLIFAGDGGLPSRGAVQIPDKNTKQAQPSKPAPGALDQQAGGTALPFPYNRFLLPPELKRLVMQEAWDGRDFARLGTIYDQFEDGDFAAAARDAEVYAKQLQKNNDRASERWRFSGLLYHLAAIASVEASQCSSALKQIANAQNIYAGTSVYKIAKMRLQIDDTLIHIACGEAAVALPEEMFVKLSAYNPRPNQDLAMHAWVGAILAKARGDTALAASLATAGLNETDDLLKGDAKLSFRLRTLIDLNKLPSGRAKAELPSLKTSLTSGKATHLYTVPYKSGSFSLSGKLKVEDWLDYRQVYTLFRKGDHAATAEQSKSFLLRYGTSKTQSRVLLRGYLNYIHAMALVELGRPAEANQFYALAHAFLASGNAPQLVFARLEVDTAIARQLTDGKAYKLQNTYLDVLGELQVIEPTQLPLHIQHFRLQAWISQANGDTAGARKWLERATTTLQEFRRRFPESGGELAVAVAQQRDSL